MPRHALNPVLAAAFLLASLVSACAGTASTAAPSPAAPSRAAPSHTPAAVPTKASSITPSRPPLVIPASLPPGTVGVNLGIETNGVAVCAGSVWVAYSIGDSFIAQVDPATGTVLGIVEGGLNTACFDGQPWVTVTTAVQHLDPATRAVLASVPLENAYYVGTGDGSVWSASGLDVVRIDPTAATIIATIGVGAGSDVTEVDGDDDAIWATVKRANKVFRIDPATNAVVADIAAGEFAHGILVQPDAIWISNAHEESVTRVDPVTNIPTSIKGPGSGVGLAEGAGFVWASTVEGDLYRIDPETNAAKVVGHVEGWPYGIGFLDGVLWVTDGRGAVYGIPVKAFLPSS